METQASWPAELLETPSDWGETVIGSREGMEDYLAEVRREGGADAEHCIAEECGVLDLVRPLDAATALYHGETHHDGYHRNTRRYGVAIRRTGPDATDYRRVDYWDTADDCDYEAA